MEVWSGPQIFKRELPATPQPCPIPTSACPRLYFRDSQFFVFPQEGVYVLFWSRVLCLKDGCVNVSFLREVYFLFMFIEYSA